MFSLMRLVAFAMRADKPLCEEFSIYLRDGSQISAARQGMVLEAKEGGCSHLLFVDEDMRFTPDAVSILAEHDLEIVGANYRRRTAPHDFITRGLQAQVIKTTAETTGCEMASVIGMGLCLIKLSVFDRLEKPWFIEEYAPKSGLHVTEDVHFCKIAAGAGIQVWVSHDATKQTSHSGRLDIPWNFCE
jgi:hypothetical protein